MASPFPGMAPYLEGELWQEVHERLANQISAQLMPLLAPTYVALLARRYVLDRPALGVFDIPPPARVFYPDVHVAPIPATPRTPHPSAADAPATASLTPPTLEVASPAPIPQLSVEIRDVAARRLVTIIELLSPANKVGDGAREYNARRVELLQTQAHLLEIDLLRGGTRIAVNAPLPSAAYAVYLSRTERRPFTLVWAIPIRERLPTVPVPLRAPDPDVPLDLQAALAACFALVGYERLLDYTAPPPPPELPAPDRAWLDATLHAAGWRQMEMDATPPGSRRGPML